MKTIPTQIGGYPRFENAILKDVLKEMDEALQSGALFNPEMFGSMLKEGDNPILRWRDAVQYVATDASFCRKHMTPLQECKCRVETTADSAPVRVDHILLECPFCLARYSTRWEFRMHVADCIGRNEAR